MNFPPAESGTKGKLLRAAAHVFAEKGYIAATVRDICQRADANVAAVNYHFGDKKNLYDAVLRRLFSECEGPSEQELDTSLPAEERLAAFIRRSVLEIYGDSDLNDDYGQLAALFLMELAHPSENWPNLIHEYMLPDSLLLHEIVSKVLGPHSSPEKIRQCCISIYGLMAHHALCWPIISVIHDDHPELRSFRDRLAEHVIEFALTALRGIKDNHNESHTRLA
ncbi:MAG: TetR/AcrR family transcriptional regulator [Desulfovibrionaceae bacterium]